MKTFPPNWFYLHPWLGTDLGLRLKKGGTTKFHHLHTQSEWTKQKSGGLNCFPALSYFEFIVEMSELDGIIASRLDRVIYSGGMYLMSGPVTIFSEESSE